MSPRSSSESMTDKNSNANAHQDSPEQPKPKKTKLTPLRCAPPPWHSLVICTVLFVLFTSLLPSFQQLDQVATVETFTHRLFPNLISIKQLALIRLTFAAIIVATSIQYYTQANINPNTIMSTYLKQSKLIPAPIRMEGIYTQLTFTALHWNFLGVGFAIAGYVAWQQARVFEEQQQNGTAPASVVISPFLLRAGIVLWSMNYPFSALVSFIVRYALWPLHLKNGNSTELYTRPRSLLMHNLNILSSMTELALLGGLPILWRHVSFPPLFEIAYIVTSWSLMCSWGGTGSSCQRQQHLQKYGPQFIYFFMDTTIPGFFPSAALLAVLGVQLTAFGIFATAGSLLPLLPGGFMAHMLFVVGVCASVMRFRD